MTTIRGITNIIYAKPTHEGAGVLLNRVFGYSELPLFDPFLMLDDFRSDNPRDYIAGFPWHPHRGIETVTYMLDGLVEHGDSMGNTGLIGAGSVQWMTAGSGIIHQEMPRPVQGKMGGFQLWVNLPAKQKMMNPRYQEITSRQIPTVEPSKGVMVKVIAGTLHQVTGPVIDIIAEPLFIDVTLQPDVVFEHEVPEKNLIFAYVFAGEGIFAPDTPPTKNRTCIRFEDGNKIQITASHSGVRFLLIGGKPILEPIAWRGPIVMNTNEEIRIAFDEYAKGTFIHT